MKQLVFLLSTGLIILYFLTSCYYNKDDKLNPPEGFSCDTTGLTFNGSILDILAYNCLKCHSNTAAIDAGSGIYLDTYAGVKARAKSISGAINRTGGYFPMPKNEPKLDRCLILQFDTWLRNGMPEN